MSFKWCITSTTALLSLALAIVLADNNELPQKQMVVMKSFSESEERGTDELRFSVCDQDGLFSGTIIFKRPLDDTVQAVVEVARWMDPQNEWGRTFHVHRVPDACVGFLGICPNFGKAIAQCMGIDESCPVPAGEYTLENCALPPSHATRKLPPGEFKLTVSLKNTTHLLGRVNIAVEVSNCETGH